MGIVIERNPESASRESYDLIVVGGGIHGIAVGLEAARRGLKPLILERDDFGAHTSWNSLRIIHGGLRYLQTLDLVRFSESVRERRWFLRHYPELVRPLPCLMPLYGRGLHRPSVFRLALAANRLLSAGCNDGVRADRRLPSGRVLSASDTLNRFPGADRPGLQGSALWYDAVVPDSQRLLIELLRWAASSGATALNYVEAQKLEIAGARIRAVVALDRETDRLLEYRAPIVVNCAGPWNRSVARRFDRDVERLLNPMLAFNVFLDVEPEFECAVAVTPGRPGSQTYFLHPWKGGVLAGTYQTKWRVGAASEPPAPELVESFLGELRVSIPGFEVGLDQVTRVYWGLLPTKRAGGDRLAVRDVIHHHEDSGGPTGLVSVTGVKLTTARRVAERTLRAIHRHARKALPSPLERTPPTPVIPPCLDEFRALVGDDSSAAKALLERVIETESVVRMEDLLLRRTDWGTNPAVGRDFAERLHTLLNSSAAVSRPTR